MSQFLQLLLFGLVAAAGNLFGGWVIARSQRDDFPRLKYLLALGAGFMLSAVILEVLPEIFQQWNTRTEIAMGWMLAGYLLIQLVEHTIAPHFHFGKEGHQEEIRAQGVAVTAITALVIHAFFDGVTMAAGLLTNFRLGVLLFIGVLLHKIPEGFTVASIMLSAGRTQKAALIATAIIAVATLAGTASVVAAANIVQYALPLSAGATLYIAASDLIPEVNREGGWRVSAGVFLGVACFYLTHLLLHDF